MSAKAVFLDRDGTLNEDPGYLGDENSVVLLPGVVEALDKLKNKYNFLLIVVSNQSGIARGLITDSQVQAVNKKISDLLSNHNIKLDAFYYCPSHPEFSSIEDSKCRKPSPQMIFEAAEKFDVDLSKSYMVGDSHSDVEAGLNAGIKTILLKTGIGTESISILQNQNKFPSFVAENILDACNFIVNDSSGENL